MPRITKRMLLEAELKKWTPTIGAIVKFQDRDKPWARTEVVTRMAWGRPTTRTFVTCVTCGHRVNRWNYNNDFDRENKIHSVYIMARRILLRTSVVYPWGGANERHLASVTRCICSIDMVNSPQVRVALDKKPVKWEDLLARVTQAEGV